ncbi:MAG: hypothetical protein ACK54C_00105 [Betaproteobacteria bacterium]
MANARKRASKAGKSAGKGTGARTRLPAGISAASATKPRGRPFPKGVSGNPAGRPKVPEHVREACRALTDKAVQTLRVVMDDGDAPAAARVSAANAVLDRAWGKPESDVRVGGLPGAPPIVNAQIDPTKITPDQAYQFVINCADLPPEVWAALKRGERNDDTA